MKQYRLGDYGSLAGFVWRHFRRMLPALTPAKAGNALRALIALAEGRPVLSSRPFVVRADVSAVCNLRCPPCRTWRDQKKLPSGQRFMSLETFRKVVAEVRPSCLRLSLYDTGEPLMNPDFYRIVREAAEAGIPASVSTNFTLFTPADLDALFDSRLSHLEVCLDGFSQDAYAQYRVGGDVEALKTNLELICAEKRARGLTHPEVDVQVVKFSHLRDEIALISDFCRRIGVDSLTLREENLGFDPKTAGRKKKRKKLLRRCYWLWLGLLIKADGSVSPCCGRRPIFGDIAKESLDEIWNNESFVESRKAVVDPNYRPKVPTPCGTCSFYL
ncbi:MAG: SPASM domain-containing protein [Candidatus Aureabacteria bacterium]|nr:SPASM domain-containing protein [Candidatus Auribacterota bacterium]